jgi:hypothetical protein
MRIDFTFNWLGTLLLSRRNCHVYVVPAALHCQFVRAVHSFRCLNVIPRLYVMLMVGADRASVEGSGTMSGIVFTE